MRPRKKNGIAMTVAWAIGTTMLVVCGSTMHPTQASSKAMRQEYPRADGAVKGTDVTWCRRWDSNPHELALNGV